MNRLRSGIMGLVGVFAAMLVCGCSPDKFIVRGESGASVLSVDAHGFIRITGPIATEVPLESEDLAEHAGRGEFLVRNGNGQNVARVDGRTGNLYLRGQLERVPQLEASALPEFVITDAAGTAVALIDAYGNLKYRGRIGMLMTRTVSSTEYAPCDTLNVTVSLYYYDAAPLTALGLLDGLQEGWTYVGWVSGTEVDIEPETGDGPLLDFAWVTPPEFPVTFTYQVRVPQNAQGDAVIAGQGLYRTDGPELRSNPVFTFLTENQNPEGEVFCEGEQSGMQSPGANGEDGESFFDFGGDGEGEGESCPVAEFCQYHCADQNSDWQLDLSELLRVIQFYNSRGYQCALQVNWEGSTEDGYVPGLGPLRDCKPHDSDYAPQDWQIDLTELLRLIQFFNMGGYHTQAVGTEDGFAPRLYSVPAVLVDLQADLETYMAESNQSQYYLYAWNLSQEWYRGSDGNYYPCPVTPECEEYVEGEPGCNPSTWACKGNLPDVAEFAVLKKMLSKDTGYESVRNAWVSYTCQLTRNLPEASEAARRVLAAYLTLGYDGAYHAALREMQQTYHVEDFAWLNRLCESAHNPLNPREDADQDTFANDWEWDYLSLYWNDPVDLVTHYVDFALSPGQRPPDIYRNRDIITTTVHLFVEGGGYVFPGVGSHQFATYRWGCNEPNALPMPPGCEYNQIPLKAQAAPGWAFRRWRGLDDDREYDAEITLSMEHPWIIRNVTAEFISMAHRSGLDLPADLAATVEVVDGNGRPNPGDPNGIPDAAEFLLLERFLEQPNLDFGLRSGVVNDEVYAAWTHNLAQAQTDLNRTLAEAPSLIRTYAAFMTLGDPGSTQWALQIADDLEDIDASTIDVSQYDRSQARYLGPFGNADNDAWPNVREWEYVAAREPEDPQAEYAAAAADPDTPDANDPAPSPVPPPACACADLRSVHFELELHCVPAENDPGRPTTTALMRVRPAGYDQNDELVSEFAGGKTLRYPEGAEVEVSVVVMDKTFVLEKWTAPNNPLDESRDDWGRFFVSEGPGNYVTATCVQGNLNLHWHTAHGNVVATPSTEDTRIRRWTSPSNSENHYLSAYAAPGTAITFDCSHTNTHWRIAPEIGCYGTPLKVARKSLRCFTAPYVPYVYGYSASAYTEVFSAFTNYSVSASSDAAGHAMAFWIDVPSYLCDYELRDSIGGTQHARIPIDPFNNQSTRGTGVAIALSNPGYRFVNWEGYPETSCWWMDDQGTIYQDNLNLDPPGYPVMGLFGNKTAYQNFFGNILLTRVPIGGTSDKAIFARIPEYALEVSRLVEGIGDPECAGYVKVGNENMPAKAYYPPVYTWNSQTHHYDETPRSAHLQAVPHPGYRFVEWRGDGQAIDCHNETQVLNGLTDPDISLVMDSERRDIIAVFAESGYGTVTMPFKYRLSADGATVSDVRVFSGLAYSPNTPTYCCPAHLDPDGNKYLHAHLPHGFPFKWEAGDVTVTQQMSDWAWDAQYTNQTRQSSSTFSVNCFAHSCGAPTVMFDDAWTNNFTLPSSLEEATSKIRSFGHQSHVVRITSIHNRGTEQEPDYVVSASSEKNASGGVYSGGWLPLGLETFGTVRKCK